MADRSVRVVLSATVSGFTAQMRAAQKATQDFTSKSSSWIQKNEQQINTLSTAAGAMGLALTAAVGAAAKAAIDWESAWAGVIKTVDGTPEQLAAVEAGLRDLARELPASHTEIAAVAEAAGQLGIATGDVVDFTRTMIDLGETTNLTAEDAATALARISNIMGTAASDVDRMGSTIVDLGNNAATTEREILELGTRLAAAGKQAGLTEADVFAIAAALSSVGVEAEAGGSAMSKVFIAISDAVRDGGDKLETFARVSGMTAEQFQTAFAENGARAIGTFVEGMGRLSREGQSTTQVFKDLGLTDQRLMRSVLSVGSATGLWADQLDLASRAWEENTALTAEAAQRYETTASKMQVAWNNVTDAAIEFGAASLPLIDDVSTVVSELARRFGALPDPIKTATMAIAGSGGLALLAIAGLGKMVIGINNARLAMQNLGISARTASIAVGAVAGVLAIATIGITAWATSQAEARERARSLTDTLDELTGALTDNSRAFVTDELVKSGAARAYKVIGGDVADLVDAALGAEDALARVNAILDKRDEETAWTTILGTFKGMDETVNMVRGGLNDVSRAVEKGTADWQLWKEGMQEASAASAEAEAQNLGTASSVDQLTASIEESDDAHQEWIGTVVKANESFISIQGAYDAVVAKNKELGREAKVTAASYIKELERQVEAQLKWQDNLISISERVNKSMTGEMREAANAMIDELIKLGPEGAEQVKLLASMSDKELAKVVELYGIRGGEAGARYGGELAETLNKHRIPEIKINADITPALASIRHLFNMWDGKSITTYHRLLNSPAGELAGRRKAAGGYISGPGTGTSDSIPAWLSNGEYVIRASAVKQYGRGFLDAVNAQRFALGGFVEPKRFAVGGYASSVPASAPAASVGFPSTVTLVDASGALLGRMRVVADEQAARALERTGRVVGAGVR